ncbi:hypothetical protein T492DRAFT_849588 [Pavlovales sp. CCMP2436]|nr:hypothetical protein T492DRAFT_849588 [Pavlovales sp. CCMP2436]
MEQHAMEIKLRLMQQKLEMTRAQAQQPPFMQQPGAGARHPFAVNARPSQQYAPAANPATTIAASSAVWEQQQRVQRAIDENAQLERQLVAARRANAIAKHPAPKPARAAPQRVAPRPAQQPQPQPYQQQQQQESPFEAAMLENFSKQTEMLQKLTDGRAQTDAAPLSARSAVPPLLRDKPDDSQFSALARLQNKGIISSPRAEESKLDFAPPTTRSTEAANAAEEAVEVAEVAAPEVAKPTGPSETELELLRELHEALGSSGSDSETDSEPDARNERAQRKRLERKVETDLGGE